ncbi:hypothetical protein BaRGS_00030881 [Batillaria attramentaria]|uniref:Uncharacterized protein n=1 Tax=Batillaria attramentaria TaxID=370345 RepID=A0ABD0JT76_9CAEN
MGSGRIYMPSLPTPRPLRIALTSPERKQSLYDVRSAVVTSRDKRKPKLLRSVVTEEKLGDIVSRLTRPTLASRLKSVRIHPVVNYVDMDYYAWNRMELYSDYQRQVYSTQGCVKPSFKKCGGQRTVYVQYSYV